MMERAAGVSHSAGGWECGPIIFDYEPSRAPNWERPDAEISGR